MRKSSFMQAQLQSRLYLGMYAVRIIQSDLHVHVVAVYLCTLVLIIGYRDSLSDLQGMFVNLYIEKSAKSSAMRHKMRQRSSRQ